MDIKTMEEAAVVYRKVEASLEAKQLQHEAACAKERRALEQLQTIMLAMLNQAGVKSMNVPGVAEVKIVPKRVFGCADWDLFYTWVVTHNTPELLQKRIHDGNMQHWIDTNGGAELPPAVSVYTENVLKILKGKE